MGFLNRIELQGVVGTVRRQKVADKEVVNFSMVTEDSHKDASGCAVIDVLWLNVTAWQNCAMPDLSTLGRGSQVHVQGRLRARRYTDDCGAARTSYEVLAASVHLLDSSAPNDC